MGTSKIMSKTMLNHAEPFIKAIQASSVTKEQAVEALSSPEFIEALKEADKRSQIQFQMIKHALPPARRRFLELHFKKEHLSLLEKLEKKVMELFM